MLKKRPPRLLIVDDDADVVAAYRLVLEKAPDSRAAHRMFGLESLEAELFGPRPSEEAPLEWRIKILDQGLDAVKAVQWAMEDGDPFTAIFLDVRMPPGIDGHETARRIRLLDPNVHIVIVTGYSDYTFDDFVKVAGPAHLLTHMPKPVWPDELLKVARSLVWSRKLPV